MMNTRVTHGHLQYLRSTSQRKNMLLKEIMVTTDEAAAKAGGNQKWKRCRRH